MRGWLGYYGIAEMKERYGKVERVASQKNTNVYLEAVEEAENKGREPEEVGNARLAGIPKRKYP